MTAPIQRLRAKVVVWETCVRRVDDVGASMIEFGAEQPTTSVTAGDVVALRATGSGRLPTGAWRRYTVATADADRFAVVADLGGSGPGTGLLRRIRVGDLLAVRGPERGVGAPPGVTVVIAAGDATAVGTFRAIADARTVEVRACIVGGPSGGDDRFDCVATLQEVDQWCRRQVSELGVSVGVVAAGEHQLVGTIKQTTLELGVPRRRVVARVYWRPGRSGLE